jgi:hypothetical protein
MAALHVYFNWRVIVGYLRTRLGEGMRRKRELALSSALAVGVLSATIAGVPPFRTVMTVGETLKNSWATTANEPPVPHAETWTLAKFAETTRVPIEEATANLAKAGIVVSGADATLQEVANQHGMTPAGLRVGRGQDLCAGPARRVGCRRRRGIRPKDRAAGVRRSSHPGRDGP